MRSEPRNSSNQGQRAIRANQMPKVHTPLGIQKKPRKTRPGQLYADFCMCRSLAIFRTIRQLESMNHMHQENPKLYFAVLADFILSVQKNLEQAEEQAPGTDLQSMFLSEARFKLIAAATVIDRVCPPPEKP